MIDNTFLGLKGSEHHRHHLEAEAAKWELAHELHEEQIETPSAIRRKCFLRSIAIGMLLVVLVTIMNGFTLTSSSYAEYDDSPLPVPTREWSGSGSTGSDAFPTQNLLQ